MLLGTRVASLAFGFVGSGTKFCMGTDLACSSRRSDFCCEEFFTQPLIMGTEGSRVDGVTVLR